MTYKEAREFIDDCNKYGWKPGLDTIKELLRRLGNPQDKLRCIHVGGTNGKGSTVALLSSILSQAGYRVGRYVSPAVFTYEEMIQIESKEKQTQFISKDSICKAIELIKPLCASMVMDGFAHPTTFEIETAIAFLYFTWERVDLTILEVGMGGRLDATNVIKSPVCSVITSIGMEHMQFLGETLDKIAREKAGIIKATSPVITFNQQQEAIEVIQEISALKNSPLTIVSQDNISNIHHALEGIRFSLQHDGRIEDYHLGLLGEHQVKNAALAIETAKIMNRLGYPIDDEAIKNGLSHARWRGRFEIVHKNPYIVVDGAHNIDAAMNLKASIELYFPDRRLIYIMGVLADKDYNSILSLTAPLAHTIITITPNNSRALSSQDLSIAARKYCNNVIDSGNIDGAIEKALTEAKENDVIIAFGSLTYLGDLINCLNVRKED